MIGSAHKRFKESFINLFFRNKNADSHDHTCGSGVTACHTILAMDYAGLEIPKLYVGSWSEWCRNDKEIVVLWNKKTSSTKT